MENLYLCSRLRFSKTDNFLKMKGAKVSQNGLLPYGHKRININKQYNGD